jgi:hypothetical protein
MYIPVSAVKTYLKYTVTKKNAGTSTYIFVGKVVTLKGKTTPTPTPSIGGSTSEHATSDLSANIDWMVKNLEFQRIDEKVAMYNPINSSVHGALITVGYDPSKEYETVIVLKNWGEHTWYYVGKNGIETRMTDNKTNSNTKALFNFYFPKNGNKLYDIVDKGNKGEGGTELLDKVQTFDNRNVMISFSSGWLYIYIGEKNNVL